MSEDTEALAEILGALPEAYNVTWMNDEQTTSIMIDVDILAETILASDWLANYVAGPRDISPAERRSMAEYSVQHAADASEPSS